MRHCDKCFCVAVARSKSYAVGERHFYCPYHWVKMKLWVRAAKKRIPTGIRAYFDGEQ